MGAPRRGANGNARAFGRLLEAARGATTGDVSEERTVAGRRRFLVGLGPRAGRSRFVGFAGAGMLAAGAAAAQVGHRAPVPSNPGDTGGPQNGYVSGAGRDASPTVRFAGGSRVEFAAGSRGRVGASSAMPARVVLEGGRASVHGEARPQQGLVVEAGPYALRGGGAAFDVSWSGSVFEVRVASGAVVLRGPAASQGLTLHEDQSFVARDTCGDGRCF
jgi:ferric-dicitrate binding protein FerR (iron transport regulator)